MYWEREPEKENVYVEIEVEGIDLTNFNETEFLGSVSDLTNIDPDKLRIRAEVNENDEVVRVLVFVSGTSIAETVSERVNQLNCNTSSSSSDPYGSSFSEDFS